MSCSGSTCNCSTSCWACSKAACALCIVSIALSPAMTAFLNRALARSIFWTEGWASLIACSSFVTSSSGKAAAFDCVCCLRVGAFGGLVVRPSVSCCAPLFLSCRSLGASPCSGSSARCLPLRRSRAPCTCCLVVTTLPSHNIDPFRHQLQGCEHRRQLRNKGKQRGWHAAGNAPRTPVSVSVSDSVSVRRTFT